MPKDRLLQELYLIDKYSKRTKKLKEYKIVNENPLTIYIKLSIRRRIYEFNVEFCSFFPYQPIIVKKITKFYTPHSYSDGTMCLKYGVDNWSQSINIKMILDNLIELLEIENPLGKKHGVSPSGHEIEAIDIVNSNNTAIISEKLRKEIDKISGKTIAKGYLFEKTNNNKLKTLYLYGMKIKKRFINQYNLKEFIILKDDNLKIDKDILSDEIRKINYPENVLIVIKSTYIFINVLIIDKKYLEGNPLTAKQIQKEFPKEYEKVILGKEKLIRFRSLVCATVENENKKRSRIKQKTFNKKIVIFGLGSVGSRVFIDLVRAGFKNFFLVDNDNFIPSNLVRHELNMENFGGHKVEELSKMAEKVSFKDLNLYCLVENLTGQHSSTYIHRIYSKISEYDLIIDCSADSNLIYTLSDFVQLADIPYISGSVLSGGVGNIITNRKKGSEISLIDLLETQKKFFEINKLDFEYSNNYEGTFGQKTYIATMSDVSIIAGLIGKQAINLLENNKNEILKNDIYITSTSDNFLGGMFFVQPLNANKYKFISEKISKNEIKKGKEIYENYIKQKM